MSTRLNQQWLLTSRPVGELQPENFSWHEEELPPLEDGQVLVRAIYLSLDPTNRSWAGEKDTYLPALPLGSVMRGFVIGVVEESRHPKFTAGQYVEGLMGWQSYYISDGRDIRPLHKDPDLPLDAYMGYFGMISLTAYFGLLDIGQPKEGETVVVSAAAGAVGSLVGQIAKIKGCRVVGIAGSDEKCRWLTQELGFDGAINYKTESVSKALRQHCPQGIDVYFDNVGGKILDAVLGQINLRARIVICGLISMYNATEPVPGPYNLVNLIPKRAKMEGFVVLDYFPRAKEAMPELTQWLKEGKVQYRVHIVEGLKEAPTAVNLLFTGGNEGKLMVRISPE